MKETENHPESIIGDEWVFYGSDPGNKTNDLYDFDRIKPKGLNILRGISIGASFFREFLDKNHIAQNPKYEEILVADLPDSLLAIADKILAMTPENTPLAVRSSSTTEKGASGIFYSGFVPVRSDDLNREYARRLLYREIKKVYASCFTPAAKTTGEHPEMGILIQPVVGDHYLDRINRKGIYMPIMSGVMTVSDGHPIVRIVRGLGTKSVAGDSMDVHTYDLDRFESVTNFFTHSCDAVNMFTGQVDDFQIENENSDDTDAEIRQVKEALNIWRKVPNPPYCEFALDGKGNFYIVQAAPKEPRPIMTKLPEPVGRLLCEGTDTLNTGIADGRGILYFGKSAETDLSNLRSWNSDLSGYLLIVPDLLVSRYSATADSFDVACFNNAAAVIEIQKSRGDFMVDHTKDNRGGEHMSELMESRGILFVGSVTSDDQIFNVLGLPTISLGKHSAYWDAGFRAANIKGQGRVEITSAPVELKYTADDFVLWHDLVRRLASKFDAQNNLELANALYDIEYDCFPIGAFATMNNFNAFSKINEITEINRKHISDCIVLVKENLNILGLDKDLILRSRDKKSRTSKLLEFLIEFDQLLKQIS